MGKKKDERKAKAAALALEVPAPAPVIPFPMRVFSNDPRHPVSISTQLTEADRLRLKTLAIEEGTTVQRLGHRAWNAFLAGQGLPGLTPVLQGKPKRRQADD